MTARLKKASRCFFLLRLADLAAMGLMQIEKGDKCGEMLVKYAYFG